MAFTKHICRDPDSAVVEQGNGVVERIQYTDQVSGRSFQLEGSSSANVGRVWAEVNPVSFLSPSANKAFMPSLPDQCFLSHLHIGYGFEFFRPEGDGVHVHLEPVAVVSLSLKHLRSGRLSLSVGSVLFNLFICQEKCAETLVVVSCRSTAHRSI